MSNKKVVTSALPYIHGTPHLGNVVGSLLPADIFHRYLDLRGEDNIFVCGSDVHGTPLELEALDRGVEVQELAEQNHRDVKSVLEDFNLDFSIYSQTHSDFNRKQTHDMFEQLYCNGHVIEEQQDMAFCNNDERFLPDRYIEGECPECGGLARGDQCDDCGSLMDPDEIIDPECQICGGSNVDFRSTKHLSLDLGDFKQDIRSWVESDPIPEGKKQEVLNAAEQGETRTITRDIDWGFSVPVERVNRRIREEGLDVPELDASVYEDKVLYVWFDAPIGYMGFTREYFEGKKTDWSEYWTGDSEVFYSIGKDNTIFHAVIWPSMLSGGSPEDTDYVLPEYEFIQNFLISEDIQFSKSRGEGLTTASALEHFPADYWRFYLAYNLPETQDTRFSAEDFEDTINSVLNDTVGNFVNRTVSLVQKYYDGEVPSSPGFEYRDEVKLEEIEELQNEYKAAFEDRSVKLALDSAVSIARLGDSYLSEEEPWKNESRRAEVLQVCLRAVRSLGVCLYPFTPDASRRIMEMIGCEVNVDEGYDELVDASLGGVQPADQLKEPEILFEKVSGSELKTDMGEQSGEVSVDDFAELDLAVAEVESVEDHPNADNLYVLHLGLGDKTLQTCSGLKDSYTPEQLEGKSVVVVENLEEAELRGVVSETMVLAAEDDSGKVSLIGPDTGIDPGSEIS
jgi:methionyl-tRNA synthetase